MNMLEGGEASLCASVCEGMAGLIVYPAAEVAISGFVDVGPR